MDDNNNQQIEGNAQHHECAHCAVDEKAMLRQQKLEENYQRFEDKAKDIVKKGQEFISTLREATKPLAPKNIASSIDYANDKLSDLMLRTSERNSLHQQETANKQRRNISMKVAASVTALSALASPISSIAPVEASEPIRVTVPLFDLEQAKEVVANLSSNSAITSRYEPYLDEATNTPKLAEREVDPAYSGGNNQSVSSEVEQTDENSHPEIRFGERTAIDISNVKAIHRTALAKAMNVQLEEGQTVVEIQAPQIRNLKMGQNPTDLALDLLGLQPEEFDNNKPAIYALTMVIVDMNNIDTSKGEDRIIQPTDDLLVPYETKVVVENHSQESPEPQYEAVIDIPETEPAQRVEVEETVKAQAEIELDQLIEAIKSIENPVPAYQGIATAIPQSTPVADRLERDKETIIASLETGQTNLGYVQTEAIIDTALEHSGLTVDSVARQMVLRTYAELGVVPTQEELGNLADEVVKGIANNSQIITNLAQAENIKIDPDSKPIAEIANELNAKLSQKQALIDEASSNLMEHGLEIGAYKDAAKRMLSDEAVGSLRGDEYYYLLLDGGNTIDNVEIVRTGISTAIYENYHAQDLLLDTEKQVKMIGLSAELLSSDYIELGSYIDKVESDLVAQLEKGKELALPVVAEIAAIFEETNAISDEKLMSLAVEAVRGASTDYLRMIILDEIANSKQLSTEQIVSLYYQSAFNNVGLENAFDSNQISELAKEAAMVWETEEFESRLVSVDAQLIINETINQTIEEFVTANQQYLNELESNSNQHDIEKLIKIYLNSNGPRESYDVAFIFAITADHDLVDKYLEDYFTANGVGNFITQDDVVKAIADELLSDPSKAPADYLSTLASYSGNPEEIFPEGKQYVLPNYQNEDLTKFFEASGLDLAEILDHPLNSHITSTEVGLISEVPYIWFEEGSTLDIANLKKAYDEQVLKIKSPEIVASPQEAVEPNKSSSNEIINSLANIRFEDKVNNLDGAVQTVTEWYQSFDDPNKDPNMPAGYVRMPSHEFFDDLNVLFTWAEKTANSEAYASPVTVAGTLAMTELYHQMIADYPEYEGSMLRLRDFNSAHHGYHHDGRQVDLSTHMNAEVTQASTGPLMDYISGDGTENDYNFDLNVAFAVSLASLSYEGKRAISSILTSDKQLVAAVNKQLGFKFMSRKDYHHEHWHVNFHKRYALDEFRPVSPFEELGHKGDLGIGSEYKEPTPEMVEKEHGEFQDAIVGVVEEVKTEAGASAPGITEAKPEEVPPVAEQSNPVVEETNNGKQTTTEEIKPPVGSPVTNQEVVESANTIDQLVNLGYASLAKIPQADQDLFNEVLSQKPTIDYAIENYNSRQGDPRGPKLPATAVLAIAYDLGMRGDDLLDTVTTLRGESVGFAPYVIGDDKGVRTSDGEVTRFSVGLGQFYQHEENGFTEAEMERAENLLHPVAAIIEVTKYKERRGLQPWNFFNNRNKDIENWNAHKAKVLSQVEILENSGFDIIP